MSGFDKKRWYHLNSRALSNLVVVCAGVLLYLGVTHFPQVKTTVRVFLNVLSPFIGGFVIAYLLNTPVNFFERKVYAKFRNRRALAIATVFILALCIIAVLLQLVLPQVLGSLSQLVNNVSYYLDNLNQMVKEIVQHFNLEADGLFDIMKGYNQLVREAATFLSNSIPDLLNFGMAVGNGVINTITAIIVAVYMLAGKTRLTGQLKKLIYAVFPTKSVNRILEVGSRANEIFVGFIYGKIIDSAIIGVLCFFLSSLVRIPYAILISVIIGVTNVIPFFGPIIGAVPCLMILVIVDPWAALRFGVLIVALQQFDGNILGPKILGNSTGLSAIWVLVAIVVGGGLFGFMGMLLGVPTFAVLYSLIREWTDHRLEEKGIDRNGNPVGPPRKAGNKQEDT